MARLRKRPPRRGREGHVSYYPHHGGWCIYYRDGAQVVRRRVADDEQGARQAAAQINAQLAASAPTFFSFTPVTVCELRRRFLDHHEHVLRSSLATISRYRTATQHLQNYIEQLGRTLPAHQVSAEGFVRYLRLLRVAPNGHANTRRRPLRDKGVRFILETCRSMYGHAAKKRHLPPYSENPFGGLGGKRFQIEDAKRVFVFDDKTEADFLRAADDWGFAIHFTLAKTGLRPGELIHLLVEEVDLNDGWINVCNKPELSWRIKTRRERRIPFDDELAGVLSRVIGNRRGGPVFLRQKFVATTSPLANTTRAQLQRAVELATEKAEAIVQRPLSRQERDKLARAVWRHAGAVRAEAIRKSFGCTMTRLGRPEVTCPKCWRHTFATLLQDAGVDPLVRQLTLGTRRSAARGRWA